MFGQYLFGDQPIAAIALLAASGLSFTALNTALSSRVLQVAPGSVDLAAAGASTVVNVGITAGAFIGSLLLPTFGVSSTTLVGGLLSLAALAIVLTEPLLASSVRQRESSTLPAANREPSPV
jgi:DHA1 family inner membrane transport protein